MKKLLAITLTLALLCGLFVVPSLADAEPEETSAVEVIEPVLEEPEVEEEKEIVEEEAPKQEEEQEEEADEQDEASDPEEKEEPVVKEEEQDTEEECFAYYNTWEDDKFVYELDAEDPSDPDFRLILTKTCKSCGMSDLDELTQGQVLKRYGIDVKEK